jgi:hypothetical protein
LLWLVAFPAILVARADNPKTFWRLAVLYGVLTVVFVAGACAVTWVLPFLAPRV